LPFKLDNQPNVTAGGHIDRSLETKITVDTTIITMPNIEIVSPGFSTADADCSSMSYADGDLTMAFRDWREKQFRFTVSLPLAF